MTNKVQVSVSELEAALDIPFERAQIWAPVLDEALFEFGIIGTGPVAMFIAQVAHESSRLRFTKELWGPTAAQRRYSNRSDLGNTQPEAIAAAAAAKQEVGYFYRGYGLIQTTGYYNIKAAGEYLGVDSVNKPWLLGEPRNAARSAALYWDSRGLNRYAQDIMTCTRKINGGLNGIDDRKLLWAACKAVWS